MTLAKQRDFSLYLLEFNKYVVFVSQRGKAPSESDIDYFIENMWTKQNRFRVSLDGDYRTDFLLLTPCRVFDYHLSKPILDIMDYDYTDYIGEVKPMLMGKVEEAFGSLGAGSLTKRWDTTPRSIVEMLEIESKKTGNKIDPNTEAGQSSPEYARAMGELAYIRERIEVYNRTVLPFQLRKTMYHPLRCVKYSTTSGKTWVGKLDTITSEEDIDSFMDNELVEFRSLWVEPFHSDFNNLGVVDIDFHGTMVKDKERKRVVKSIGTRLQRAGHPILVQYTGDGYQIWFGEKSGESLGTLAELKAYVQKMSKPTKDVTFDPIVAKENNLTLIDISTYKQRQTFAMFFGFHYKPNSLSTGKVRVPIPLKGLHVFNPEYDAHPEVVLEDFSRLSAIADRFFDKVGFGIGHEDPSTLGSKPTCERADKVEKNHPLAKAAEKWKKRGFETLRLIDARDIFEGKGEFHITPKIDGWLCTIHYKQTGGHSAGGKALKEIDVTSPTKIAKLKEVKTIMSTHRGILMWDNHITRAFENMCKVNGLSEALLVGEIHERDAFGTTRNRAAIGSVINRKKIVEEDFRVLRLALIDVINIDGEELESIPYVQRHSMLEQFNTSRLNPVPIETVTEGGSNTLESAWDYHVIKRGEEGLVIHYEGKRYKVKRKFTVDVAIMAVSAESKPWMDGKKTRHVFYGAVAQKFKGQVVYVNIGPLNWGPGYTMEKTAELFDKVMGEKQEGAEDKYENSIPRLQYKTDDRLEGMTYTKVLVEPKTLVEVEFDSLSDKSTPTFGLYYRQEAKKPTQKVRSKTGWRMYEHPLQARKMMGPALIVGEREEGDKDYRRYEDISSEQGKMAGGFEIQRYVRTNPLAIPKKSYPRILRPFIKYLPKMVMYRGQDIGQALVLDYRLRFKRYHGDSFREKPWRNPIEMYRILRSLQTNSIDREWGGFSKNNTIYYGSTHGPGWIRMRTTHDSHRADYCFHTHPVHQGYWHLVSPADIMLALTFKYLRGIPWQIIIENYGTTFLTVHIRDKNTALSNRYKKFVKGESFKDFKEYLKQLEKELEVFWKIMMKEYRRRRLYRTEHVAHYAADIFRRINEKSRVFEVETVFVPWGVTGLTHDKKRMVVTNPSTGYYGVQREREPWRWANESLVGGYGDHMPRRLRFEEEFENAIARGRRADPDEKGYKIFLPSPLGDKYPWVGNFPRNMQVDFADELGGPFAASIVSPQNRPSYLEQLNSQYNVDKKQEALDQGVMIAFDSDSGKGSGSLFRESPRFTDSTEKTFGEWDLVDSGRYDASNKRKGIVESELESASKWGGVGRNLTKAEKEMLWRDVHTNPPTGIVKWDSKVQAFVEQYDDWNNLDISQEWLSYARAFFPTDEILMLEKGRLLLEAINKYTLTRDEETVVKREYSSVTPDVDDTQSSILSGLYDELSEEEEEEEYEDDLRVE